MLAQQSASRIIIILFNVPNSSVKGAILIMSHRMETRRNHSMRLSGKSTRISRLSNFNENFTTSFGLRIIIAHWHPFLPSASKITALLLFKALSIPISMKSPSGQHNLTAPLISSFLIPPLCLISDCFLSTKSGQFICWVQINLTFLITFSAFVPFTKVQLQFIYFSLQSSNTQ